MSQPIYPRDRTLTRLTIELGVFIWAGGLYALAKFGGTRSLAGFAVTILFLVIIGFIAYVFARSAVIAHLKGNGIEVSETQFPDLNNQFAQCCQALAISKRPGAYILNGNGVLNAFAIWFLGRKFVVLLSSVVDAMDENPNGIRFYIGHSTSSRRYRAAIRSHMFLRLSYLTRVNSVPDSEFCCMCMSLACLQPLPFRPTKITR